jgi:hypothetical protein
VNDHKDAEPTANALADCEEKVEHLREENAELRKSAQTFGDLAERLNGRQPARRRHVDCSTPPATNHQTWGAVVMATIQRVVALASLFCLVVAQMPRPILLRIRPDSSRRRGSRHRWESHCWQAGKGLRSRRK